MLGGLSLIIGIRRRNDGSYSHEFWRTERESWHNGPSAKAEAQAVQNNAASSNNTRDDTLYRRCVTSEEHIWLVLHLLDHVQLTE